MENPAVWIALANMVLSLIGLPVFLLWKATRIEAALREAITESRAEVDDRIGRQYREFGESIAGVRQGINLETAALRREAGEDRVFVRDTFMRRDSFYNIQASLEGSIQALGVELKARLERMEEKIDSKT